MWAFIKWLLLLMTINIHMGIPIDRVNIIWLVTLNIYGIIPIIFIIKININIVLTVYMAVFIDFSFVMIS